MRVKHGRVVLLDYLVRLATGQVAGERLFFEVNIRGVRPAGNEEIFSGKAASVEVV
jgi:FKBP-type peptidyl-prolyl cis-trans isomerase 2